MSADYWSSSQREVWTFTRERLEKIRHELKGKYNAWDGNLRIWILEQVQKLGQRLNSGQRAIATAHVYLLRIFTKIKLGEINIHLLMAAAIYVACKAEEQPVHIRTVYNEARELWPNSMPQDATMIAECEFYLIDELQSCLVVFHPYRSLETLEKSMTEATNGTLALSPQERQAVWSCINSIYASDAPILFAPHIISVSAVYVTILLRPQLSTLSRQPAKIKSRIDMLASYLGRSGIRLDDMATCVQEIVSCCHRWSTYNAATAHNDILANIAESQTGFVR